MPNNVQKYTWVTVFCGIIIPVFPAEALAQGTVVKQSKCRLMIEGITNGSVGDTITLNLEDGSTASGKVKVFKAPRALVDVDANKCTKNLVGATVAMSGSKGKKLGLGISAEGGWGSLAIKKEVGDQASLAYAGPEVALNLRYALQLKSALSVFALAGGGWHSKSIKVNSEDSSGNVSSYTLSTQSMFARGGAGAQYEIKPKMKVGSFGFLDFGFGGKLASTGEISLSYPLTSFMRYGGAAEFSYNVANGIWVGASGNFFLGSIGFNSEEPDASGTMQQVAGSYAVSGYCGALKVSYEF